MKPIDIAYMIGVKLATSRWREAIRSGEVSPVVRETIKRRMDFDPKEWGRRLESGAKSRAKALGFGFMEHPPREALPTFQQMGRVGGDQAVRYAHAAVGGGGLTLTDPHKEIHLIRGGRHGVPSPAFPIVAAHEAEEAALSSRRPSSTKYMGHLGPKPVLSDLREARLLGGEGHELMYGLRSSTGELEEARRASKSVTGKEGFIPKKRVAQIAREMLARQHAGKATALQLRRSPGWPVDMVKSVTPTVAKPISRSQKAVALIRRLLRK